MKHFIAFILIVTLMLAVPMYAAAQDGTLPEDEIVPLEETENSNDEVQEEEVKSIEILGFTIVIVPADDENPTHIAVYKAGDGDQGEEPEPLTSFHLGGFLGESVSQLAHSVPAGPEHGKIVSAFVKEVNNQRKEQKTIEKNAKKEQKNLSESEDVDDEDGSQDSVKPNKKNNKPNKDKKNKKSSNNNQGKNKKNKNKK